MKQKKFKKNVKFERISMVGLGKENEADKI